MKIVFKRILAITTTFILVSASANAQQVITTCGASKGKAFYLEPTKDSWVDDGISGGTLTFFKYPSGEYDVIFKDVVRTKSAREGGAQVVKILGSNDTVATFIVVYPIEVAEMYQLTLNERGEGTLIWSSFKNRSLGITRGAVFVSSCSR